jgi:hypothetical protein
MVPHVVFAFLVRQIDRDLLMASIPGYSSSSKPAASAARSAAKPNRSREHCGRSTPLASVPEISFLRLDDPSSHLSTGINFRSVEFRHDKYDARELTKRLKSPTACTGCRPGGSLSRRPEACAAGRASSNNTQACDEHEKSKEKVLVVCLSMRENQECWLCFVVVSFKCSSQGSIRHVLKDGRDDSIGVSGG